jgi:hypothetical protein
LDKLLIIKFEVLCNVEMKHGINKINIKLFTQQVGWLNGKGIEFPSLGSKDQTSQMTFIMVNIGILIEYCVPT